MSQCQICEENPFKYTCPKCGSKYCSLKCFKSEEHKAKDEAKLTVEQEGEKEDTSVRLETIPFDQDPMIRDLISDERFQYYMKSPALQLHILVLMEILNNMSLTNEYSTDGRKEIASKKLNDLRAGGPEENEWVNEFVEWLFNWISNWKHQHNIV